MEAYVLEDILEVGRERAAEQRGAGLGWRPSPPGAAGGHVPLPASARCCTSLGQPSVLGLFPHAAALPLPSASSRTAACKGRGALWSRGTPQVGGWGPGAG